MRYNNRQLFTLVGVCVTLVLLAATALPDASAVGAGHRDAQNCPALGTYMVGPRLVSSTGSQQGSVTSQSGSAKAGPAIIYPSGAGALSGTLTLTALTGCGSAATSGSFAVHSIFRPIPAPMQPAPGQPRSGAGASTVIVPSFFGSGVLTATGTLVQDPLHPTDPTYVGVSATVQYGQRGINCLGTCPQPQQGTYPCPEAGCSSTAPAVTRTSTFATVTGFLRWQAGSPSVVGLVFLAPPDPNLSAQAMYVSIQPISLFGVYQAT